MKKVICITLVVVLLLLSTAGCVSTDTFEKTLSCVKLDNDGNPIGTTEISVKLTAWGDLLESDTHAVTIYPFDNLSKIFPINDTNGRPSKARKEIDGKFWRYDWAFPNDITDISVGDVYYSLDFEYWAFSYTVPEKRSPESGPVRSKKVYYVASTSGTRTTEEIVEYFQGLVPRGESK